MQPNKFIKKLKGYKTSSHQAWNKNPADVLKLDWNEGDANPSQNIKESVIAFIKNGKINWYPDINNKKLIQALAKYSQIPNEYIQYFEGSDCALDYIVRTFAMVGDEVLIAGPTYDNFRVYVESVGAIAKQIYCPNIFKADLPTLIKNISKKTKMVYLVNPNNPTGVFYSTKQIETIVKKFSQTLFIIDEAYAEFTNVTAISLVKKYQNLFVTRSMSKAFGLASFRLGYIISDPQNIDFINKIRNGKNISMLTQIAAVTALKNISLLRKNVSEVKKAKRYTLSELKKIGLEAWNTPANFVLVKHNNTTELCNNLEQQNVFIRNLAHLPGMHNYARVTIGTRKTMIKFIKIIKNVIKNGQPNNK